MVIHVMERTRPTVRGVESGLEDGGHLMQWIGNLVYKAHLRKVKGSWGQCNLFSLFCLFSSLSPRIIQKLTHAVVFLFV